MRKIRLTKGKHAIVDDDDYELLKQFTWRFATGYAGTGHKILFMHRLLLAPPNGMFVDHINGDKLDNRRSNLRICSRQQNATNVRKYNKKLTSKYKGVTKEKNKKTYRVSIAVGRKIAKINGFKSEHHAAMAYDLWAKDVFGEYAGLNFQEA